MSQFNELMIEILKQKKYTYKDKNYEIVKMVKMKSPITNTWFDAVEYKALYECEWAGSFVRTIPDFLEKFKPTED